MKTSTLANPGSSTATVTFSDPVPLMDIPVPFPPKVALKELLLLDAEWLDEDGWLDDELLDRLEDELLLLREDEDDDETGSSPWACDDDEIASALYFHSSGRTGNPSATSAGLLTFLSTRRLL